MDMSLPEENFIFTDQKRLEFLAKYYHLAWQEEHWPNFSYEDKRAILRFLEGSYKQHIKRKDLATTSKTRGPVQGVGEHAEAFIHLRIKLIAHDDPLKIIAAIDSIKNSDLANYLRSVLPDCHASDGTAAYYKTVVRHKHWVDLFGNDCVDAVRADINMPELPKVLSNINSLGNYFTHWLDAKRYQLPDELFLPVARYFKELRATTSTVPPEQRGAGWRKVQTGQI